MSVEYITRQHTTNDGAFAKLMRESSEYFQQKDHVSILGEGIKDIFADDILFNKYIDKLTEGTDASEAEVLRTLMENARINTFAESSTSGISPVASLTLPTLRVLWARTGLVKAIPTEPVKQNAFAVTYNKPCIVDELGNKHYLPEALDDNSRLGDKKRLEEDAIALPASKHDLLAAVGCSKAVGDSVDRNFYIKSATIEVDSKDLEVVLKRENSKLDINDRFYAEVNYKSADGLTEVNDIVFGSVNLWDGVMNAVSMNAKVKAIKVVGFVASDAHNYATNITFEQVRKDFTIGTGDHFEASLPIEFLQDSMATYNIDGTTEVVDVMSNIIAQKLDMEIFDYVKSVYEGTNAQYFGEFDLRPAATFAGQPKDWRDELKTVVDRIAAGMKSDYHLYNGYFVIMGNPVDMMILPNVNWTFNSAVDTQSGVEVGYNLGAMSGQNRYNLVSTDLILQGDIYMLFVPTITNYKSVVYYPYTFNVCSQGYLNTRTSNVPSIMVTKRHTIEHFSSLVARIRIINNTADMLANLPR